MKCLVERTTARKRVIVYRFTKHPKNEKKSKRCNKLQLNDGRNGPHFESNQIKIKKIPNRWTFCTQIIFFNRYTTTRRKILTSETRLSLSIVENTSPEESRWNFQRQKSKKRRATKHSQWSYGASSLSGLHLWSNLLRAKSSSFHCRPETSSWKPISRPSSSWSSPRHVNMKLKQHQRKHAHANTQKASWMANPPIPFNLIIALHALTN